MLSGSAMAQSPDTAEPGSVEAIAAATTDPHYVSPWVSYFPQSVTVPSPEKFLGRIMGAPGELAGHRKKLMLMRALSRPPPVRECGCSRSAAAKKGATSSCSRLQTKLEFAISIV